MFNFFVFLLYLKSLVSASEISNSGCPVLKPVEHFNMSLVSSGVWHEVGRYPYAVETAESCISYDTRPLVDGYVGESINTPRTSAAFARAECRNIGDEISSGLLKCIISSGGHASNFIHLPLVPYLNANNEYFIPYSCQYDETKDIKQEFAWIFSRKQVSFDDVKEDVYNIIKPLGYLDVNTFMWIDHTSCNTDK